MILINATISFADAVVPQRGKTCSLFLLLLFPIKNGVVAK